MLYFLSHPIQYFSPLLRSLSKQTDLKVYYYSDSSTKGTIDKGFGKTISWDIPLLEGYSYEFLKNLGSEEAPGNRFWDVFNPGAIRAVWKNKDKVVIINGWTYSSNWIVIFAARLSGKKLWLRAENPLNQELQKSNKVRFVKGLLLRRFLFPLFVNKCLYIGTENKKFFQYYGVPERKLLFTPYGVDNDFFQKAYGQYKDNLSQLKEQLQIPANKKIILFTGKYISKKNPLDLLKAFKQLDSDDCFLLMVGDGELRPQMETYIQQNNLKNVMLTGFINQSEISKYYAVADVFVMCSGMGETWGLAVNEAMNFAKPVIVSDTCGCSVDLVQQGVNGFVFKEGNIDELAGNIKNVLSNEAQIRQMGQASLEIVRSYSVQAIVNNIQQAIEN